MVKFEDNLKIIELIDTYGSLLTDKQYKIMCNYFFDNLSFSEIGDNYSISRQAISDSINQSIKSLEMYESKLHVIARNKETIRSLTKLSENCNNSQFTNEVNAIIENLRR